MLKFDTPHLDVFAKAQIAANTINAEAGWPLLVVRPQPPRAGGALTDSELTMHAAHSPGWYDVRALYLALRKLEPSKGETISTGRRMAAMGWARRKVGTLSLWHVDNATRTRVG